jgi:hypothetical protein
MHRVPNPPKMPLVPAAEKRAQKGFGVRNRAASGLVVAAVMVVSSGASADECPAAAASCPVVSPSIIVHGVEPARREVIGRHAERMRREAFARLLGEPDPAAWRVPCDIHVHLSADSFARAVGGPPVDARGATSLEFTGERVASRRVDVMGDGPDVIPDALDHELVHVVLADHFVHAPPPRWADEGLALLFDAPTKQARHDADFRAALRRGMAWETDDLVTIEDYPTDGGRQQVFYGQSAAVVRWLVSKRDEGTFVRFLDDADEIGIEPALRRHYALDSLASLTSAWKEVAPIHTLGLADNRREQLP